MATFQKFNAFVEALAEGKHNLGSDQVVIALVAAANAPTAANAVLADLTEVDYTNLSSRAVTTDASAQIGGTYKLTLADITLQASGGAVGPFRYAILYNDTAAGDDLIGYYDYGSDLTLQDGEALTVDFDGTNGVLTLA